MKTLIVTGSCGLIGSEVTRFFSEHGITVHGIDNNQRAAFFGLQGDTRWMRDRLRTAYPGYVHHPVDIRDRKGLMDLMAAVRPDGVVHAAAQPSHDLAAEIPFDDFETNAVGTLNMLEACRRFCPESPFVYLSTNKVYGDRPNSIRLCELETRFEFDDPRYARGIDESMPIDQSLHSLFGASKASADLLVQEYGRYFDMPTCCLRGGCLTGPSHSGVELHGFLSYLVRCNIERKEYTVYGYKGKQVRDNIHAVDVAHLIHLFIQSPKCGEVYNIGGGRENACSILEAMDIIQHMTGNGQKYTYVDSHRTGDHICYYTDLSKIKTHFPEWSIQIPLEETIRQIVSAWHRRVDGFAKRAVARAAAGS